MARNNKRRSSPLAGFGSTCISSALLLLLFLAAFPTWAQAGAIYCVDADATGASNGTSWTDAYTKLQDALACASSGAQIWVAEGIYYPDEGNGQSDDSRISTFDLKDGVSLYGGFDPQTGIDAFGERDPATHITVLSGDLQQNDTTDANGVVTDWSHIVGTDNAYHVLYAGIWLWNMGVTATVDGFTVTAGRDEKNESISDTGAGLFACCGSVITLSNMVFSGNSALPYGSGGAVYFYESSQTMTDVRFTGNAGCQGGAVQCRGGTSTFTRVVFENNDARDMPDGICGTGAVSGGGLATDGAVTMTDVQFLNNTAHDSGGGMVAFSPVTIRGGLFEGNSAEYAGGGMDDNGCATLTDVTFRNNSGPSYGGGGMTSQCADSAGHYTRVSFLGNTTPGLGGGLGANLVLNPLYLVDAFIAGNQAGQGGGIHKYAGELRITNSIVSGNRAGGGAIHAYYGATTLDNVTVTGNSNEGLNTDSDATATVRNSIIWNNGSLSIGGAHAPSIVHSVVQGGCPSGATCDHVLSSDPLFVAPVSPSSAPTTAGDLHVQDASPAVDSGDNIVLPSDTNDVDADGNTSEVLPYDYEGNARRIDLPPAGGTGNGTSPFVDMGAYESADMPDLVVAKTNNVGGKAALDVHFIWTITITNIGDKPATFTSTSGVVLRDYLPLTPSQMTYSSWYFSTPDCTGTFTWEYSVVNSILTVKVKSGSITMNPLTGRIIISFFATPKTLGTFTNPRSGGYCRVDPNNVVREVQETNNDCSDTVTVGEVVVTSSIHDAAHAVISAAPVGATVHGHVTVTAPAGTAPDGDVTLGFYDTPDCSGTPVSTETLALSSGAADFSAFPATTLWHKASYAGNPSHQPGTSACALSAAYQPGPAFTVNTIDDSTLDSLCTDLHCTLREAVAAANAATGANTILFHVGNSQTLVLGSPLPTILDTTGALTIDGESHFPTVSGSDLYPVFKVGTGSTATLARLTIAHGGRTDPECTGYNLCGGGLTVKVGATATILQGEVQACASNTGGGILNEGTLTVQETTVSGNSSNEGGGILNGGTLSLIGSTVSGNLAAYYGGAILNSGALAIQNSTLSGNSVTGTSASHGGGAIDQFDGSSSSAITCSTITNNTSASPNQARSGIWLEGGTLTLRNSIVAENGGADNFSVNGGSFTSQGFNLSDNWNGRVTQPTDLTAGPLLDTLAYNGGPTYTHAVLADSPALDSGDPAGCPAVDQRGTTRPQGDRCDIGAYEKFQYTIGDLKLSKSGSHDIRLDWTAAGGACKVYRDTSPGGVFAVIASPPGSPFTDSGAQDNTLPYFYLVKALETP